MKQKNHIISFFLIFLLAFLSCKSAPSATGTDPYIPAEATNPIPTESLHDNLEFIFNNQTLGTTTIAIRRSEWNQLLKNYDYFYKNENCVKVETYTYEKDNVVWTVQNVGFRLRGNTSRFRPQGKDNGRKQEQMNAEWSQEYYDYAEKCSDDDYRQSHFKVDFSEFLEDDDDFKMADCLKGVALKRMDASCTREIFCYDLFHKYGIWTAPYASHTRLLFKFIEDVKPNGSIIEDLDNCKVTNIDYGVYEMFEEVNKQSLKAREKSNLPKEYKNPWKNNNGNLWKCAGGGDLTNISGSGIEDIRIVFDKKGKPIEKIWNFYNYDLKTNKENFESAQAELAKFIRELNNLPKTVDTETDIAKIKVFYEKWFGGESGVEFFLKTYAVSILVGMDDDYWGNSNNYYIYFDTDEKGSGRVYFIPFDYDNTLGCSIKRVANDGGVADGFKQNPLDWGRGANRPLMDRLLLVPEYREMFKKLLLEVSSEDSYWNFSDCSAQFLMWKKMVEPYLNSPDLEGHIATKWWGDYDWNPGGNSLTKYENNIYDDTRDSILYWLTDLESITFDLNGGNIKGDTSDVIIESPDKSNKLSELIPQPEKDGYFFMGWTKTKDGENYQKNAVIEKVYARWKKTSEITELFIYEIENSSYNGIEIGIMNVPDDAAIRDIYVNGMLRNSVGFDFNNGKIKVKKPVKASNWVFPYTEADKKYTIYIEYKNQFWQPIAKTNIVTITAKSGEGEFIVSNEPKYEIKNNVLTFDPEPVLSKTGGHYIMEIENNKWQYQSWNWLGDTCNNFDFSGKNSNGEYYIKNRDSELMFYLYYDIPSKEYGDYRLILYRYDETQYFRLK